MEHFRRAELVLLGVGIVAILGYAVAKPLHLLPPATVAPFIDNYAKSQYLKYAGNDPVGDKITGENAFVWRYETWTGNDKAYQQIREQIEDALASGKPASQLADEYRHEAQENQQSALAQFQWSYAVWKTLTPASTSDEKETNGLGAFFTLANTASPNTYNYARLRYLVSYQYQGGVQTSLGERLLQRDSRDNKVKAHLALDYTSEPYRLSAKKRAVQLSKELIQADPKKAGYYAVLAEAYYTAYYGDGHHKQDAVAAIAALKKYLSLAKPDEYFYGDAQRRVAELEQKVGVH